MSSFEDKLEQEGEDELKKKVDSELGGSPGGDQQGADPGNQPQGDPNAAQDQGTDDPSQSQTGS